MALSRVLNLVSQRRIISGAVMDKITLPGAFLLAIVGILPGFAQRLGITQGFASFFRRHFAADHGRCNSRLVAADRDPAAHAAVRWFDEERKDTGPVVFCFQRSDITGLIKLL